MDNKTDNNQIDASIIQNQMQGSACQTVIEDVINETLNADKPSRRVLSAAKQAIANANRNRKLLYWFYGLASAAACLFGVAVFSLVANDNSYNGSVQNSNQFDSIINNTPFLVFMGLALILCIISVILLIRYKLKQ